jgi:hypothetical protein
MNHWETDSSYVTNPPIFEPALWNTIARVEVPEIRTRLFKYLYILRAEYGMEIKSSACLEAEKVIDDFILRHP